MQNMLIDCVYPAFLSFSYSSIYKMIQKLWVPTEISAKLYAVNSPEFVKLNLFISICLTFARCPELGAPSSDSDVHFC